MKEVKAFVSGEMTPEILQSVEEGYRFIYGDPFIYRAKNLVVFAKHASFMQDFSSQLIVDYTNENEIVLSIVATRSTQIQASASATGEVREILDQLKHAFASHDRELNILDINFL